MIIRPSDLEKIVKDRQDQEVAIVQSIYESWVPEIDKQLKSYSNLFEAGTPIEVKIEDNSIYTDKVIQRVISEYGSGEDGWAISLKEILKKDASMQKDARMLVKLLFSPKPKMTTR